MLIAILLCVLPSFVACDCSDTARDFAATPRAEYVRIASLCGEDAPFDFADLTSFSAETKATLSGGKITTPFNMETLYKYSRKGGDVSYAHAKYINAVFESVSGMEVVYDEAEYGFQPYAGQDGVTRNYYLESFLRKKQDDADTDKWSLPYAYGKGEYSDLFTDPKHAFTADNLVQKGTKLFSLDALENFSGDRAGDYYLISAIVKKDKISDFAEWLSVFFPLLRLKNEVGSERLYRYFDLADTTPCSAKIEIKTSRNMLEEVRVAFNVKSSGPADMGVFEFSARTEFRSGGVTVPKLTYYSGD